MINPSGSVTVNGINDSELAEILEIKAKAENLLSFNPQQLQVQRQGNGSTLYTNATFNWGGVDGLNVVINILKMLSGEKATAQGQ